MSRPDESNERDYYAILGAHEDAAPDEIERLYKRLAVKHHPDRGGDEEEMKTLNEAYRTLGNEAARERYDAGRRGSAAEPLDAPDEPATATPPPRASPAAQADIFGGQMAASALFVALGLVLLLLVRFQYIWFLFPLALLGLFMVLVGVLLAHSTMRLARERYPAAHVARRFIWAQETVFWSLVGGGIYGVYLLMSAI
ncbi:MAG TPA: J domain-containing protein [Pyrinomonadaceae bacterium]|jgi:hypothetical protein|nr:J domain-containing protein [Pyrinomonadaceae bacterium]